jgi:hypothetical protein
MTDATINASRRARALAIRTLMAALLVLHPAGLEDGV